MSRILRTFVCLLLICCILVNLSPLNARALDPVSVGFVGVTAVVGVACIMQALGYMASSNSEPFTNTVNACADYLTESTSFVTNGMLTFAGFRNGQLSSMYAMRDLVQEVWEWLFRSNSVYVNGYRKTSSLPKLGTLSYSQALSYASACENCFTFEYGDQRGICAFEGGSACYSLSDGSCRVYNSYTTVRYWNPDTGVFKDWSYAYDFAKSGVVFISKSGMVETDLNVSLGQIQSPYQTVGTDEEIIEIEIAPVYIDLTKEVQEFPDPNNPSDDPDLDKKIPWLPIRIPSKNYDDSVINQTQQESWTGESDVEFEFDYGDSSGDGSGDNTGTDSGNSGNTGSTWKPPSDPTHFKLVDLSKFFPFCIPFDLFDFFKLLNADPVAPSFTWEIQDLSGQTYGLTVDLSQWDSVAQLFRRLQLFLFVCGLAVASRKYIKW